MTAKDALLGGKVALQRLIAAVRPPSAPPLRIDDLLQHGSARTAIDQFHALWYSSEAPAQVRWQGHPILKSPFDLWTYQEIITSSRPDVIIETGTHRGGSALFFAHIAELARHPMDVITIDFNPKLDYDPAPHRITSVRGISTADATFQRVRALLAERAGTPAPTVMVILDSDHSKQNVLAELALYSNLVTPGQWLVVEDTNVNGHPVLPQHGDGPYEAVTEFLAANDAFAPDPAGERFLLTQNPRGWLRRTGS
jgi:cephalosporin hydroxylase